ncbi:MAG: DUF2789 family protein [Polynucleobacter sp.]|uniref:DUF2789 family protein n=1 Tax=Polynucleobacter sp. TaxID=2029855 RepID=UPI0027252026|nr:DUF2789 family protein [Polynucleobacter sp.]MDO8713367.1 DUF2789 family protein [Polynucleobacter sp.]
MEKSFHPFSELFLQLGLPSDAKSIRAFIDWHAPLEETILLADAPFWTPSQARLLRDELLLDADWAEIVDQLNKDLR